MSETSSRTCRKAYRTSPAILSSRAELEAIDRGMGTSLDLAWRRGWLFRTSDLERLSTRP
eukprot:11418385-Heterocapsa_arctica.AAC.1